MGYFFLLSWTPTLLTAAKLPPATAALAGAVLQVGGTVGALTLCWWLQRHRFLAIAIMFVVAVPVVGAIGFAGLTSQAALLTATFFAGFLVLGIQSGINVVGAMIYPTSLRANGSGWQLGDRPDRLDRRPAGRRAVRRPAGAAALYVGGASVRRGRGGLLPHPSCSTRRALQRGLTCARHSNGPRYSPVPRSRTRRRREHVSQRRCSAESNCRRAVSIAERFCRAHRLRLLTGSSNECPSRVSS